MLVPIRILTAAGMLLVLTCCGIPPQIVQHRHWEMNQAIRETKDEELLLNIARIRNGGMPYFLQASSISTQFSTQQSLGASATLPEKAFDTFGVSGSVGYSESPIVTWSIPDSTTYLGRLMAPIGTDQLTVLAQTGWEASRVFRVGMKSMNTLRNAEIQLGKGAVETSSYADFREAIGLIDELSKEGVVDLSYGVKSTAGGPKIPLAQLDSRAIPPGLDHNLQFMTRADPAVVEPLKLFKPLFLRFTKESDSDPRAQRLRGLLRLDPSRYSFGFVDTANSGIEQLRTEAGRLAQIYEPDAKLTEIVCNNRSVMEILYLAASCIEMPDREVASGRTWKLEGLPNQMKMHIRVSRSDPPDAWRKARFGEYSYFIREDDLESRSNFMLLDAIFNSIVGNIPGAKPLLTLPVR